MKLADIKAAIEAKIKAVEDDLAAFESAVEARFQAVEAKYNAVVDRAQGWEQLVKSKLDSSS